MSWIKSRSRHLFFSLLAVYIFAVFASAQSTTGNISGTVTDSNGSAIPNATVTLIDEQPRTKRNVNTNVEGRFTFASVQPGTYTIRIEQQGFQTLEHRNNA